ncbi:MAG TPA: serine hydrolase [Stellaceae bacterium]|nr:serine hydrolase [Stellaceae bacterium]
MDAWKFSPAGRTATLANWRKAPHNKWSLGHVREILPSAPIEAGPPGHPFAMKPASLESLTFRHGEQTLSVAEAIDTTDTDALLVLQSGRVLLERYAQGHSAATQHLVFSISKSMAAALAGVLVAQGKLDCSRQVTDYVPELHGSGFAGASVQNLLDMTVAVAFEEEYETTDSDVLRYRRASGWDPPMPDTVTGIRPYVCGLDGSGNPHGEICQYCSVCTDVLGWVIERVGGASYPTLFSELIWKPMGAESDAYIVLDPFGVPRTAGGICATLHDVARFGTLMLYPATKGPIPLAGFVADTFGNRNKKAWKLGNLAYFLEEGAYRNQWYLDDDRPSVCMGVGIHGQWLYVDRDKELVIVKFSSQPVPVAVETDALVMACLSSIAASL